MPAVKQQTGIQPHGARIMSKGPDEGVQLRSHGDRFEGAFVEAVDESLLAFLGESGAAATYFHLKRVSSLQRREMPRNLKEFSLAVATIFRAGAPALEQSILRKLCEKLGTDYEGIKDMEFQTAVETARHRCGGA